MKTTQPGSIILEHDGGGNRPRRCGRCASSCPDCWPRATTSAPHDAGLWPVQIQPSIRLNRPARASPWPGQQQRRPMLRAMPWRWIWLVPPEIVATIDSRYRKLITLSVAKPCAAHTGALRDLVEEHLRKLAPPAAPHLPRMPSATRHQREGHTQRRVTRGTVPRDRPGRHRHAVPTAPPLRPVRRRGRWSTPMGS